MAHQSLRTWKVLETAFSHFKLPIRNDGGDAEDDAL